MSSKKPDGSSAHPSIVKSAFAGEVLLRLSHESPEGLTLRRAENLYSRSSLMDGTSSLRQTCDSFVILS